MSESVILAVSIDTFKNRLDKFLKNQLVSLTRYIMPYIAGEVGFKT